MTTEIGLTPIKERLWRTRHLPAFLTEGDIAIAKAHDDIAARAQPAQIAFQAIDGAAHPAFEIGFVIFCHV